MRTTFLLGAPKVTRKRTECHNWVTWITIIICSRFTRVYTFHRGRNRKTAMTTVPDYHCCLQGDMHRCWCGWEGSVLPTLPTPPPTTSEYVSNSKAPVVNVYLASLLLPISRGAKFPNKNYWSRRRDNDQFYISVTEFEHTVEDFGRNIYHPDSAFSWFSSGSPDKFPDSTWIGSLPLAFRSFPIQLLFSCLYCVHRDAINKSVALWGWRGVGEGIGAAAPGSGVQGAAKWIC